MAERTTQKEATISFTESDLIEMIPDWSTAASRVPISAGPSVAETLSRGDEFRRQIANGLTSKVESQEEAADQLHAVCRTLMDACAQSPIDCLAEASMLFRVLETVSWVDDDLEERESLLCTLAFVAWRASRLLDRSIETHGWEAKYRRLFKGSLAYEGTALTMPTDLPTARQTFLSGAETVFQVLMYCQEHGAANPKLVASALSPLYRLLEVESGVEKDLHQFFLAEAARLVGASLRLVGGSSQVGDWLDRAEEHFRGGSNPEPGLARVQFQRLAVCYMASRFDVVTKHSPRLQAKFQELGMEEDRVRCLILWAGSLKMKGSHEEALEILEPIRKSKSQIRPELYGWVLLQSGDIQQTLGNHERALRELAEAARLLRDGKQYIALADVNWMISGICRANGRFDEALILLETSRQDHARLGMTWPEGYHRMLIAETYLAMGRPREAETEIRAALPILEEHGMLADAVIAVNLLREAIRQRKLLPADIRDYSKPKA